MSESVLISIIGCGLGLLLATLLCGVMRQMPSMVADMSSVVMPGYVWAAALAVAITVGIVSSVVPALGATRRSIVEALRYTD